MICLRLAKAEPPFFSRDRNILDTGPIINLKFINTLSHRTIFAEVTKTHSVEPDANLLPSHDILEAINPLLEGFPSCLG
jgi:hypothetical protein